MGLAVRVIAGTLTLAALCQAGWASSLTDFTVFGASSVSIGNSAQLSGLPVASNDMVLLGGGCQVPGAQGGGIFVEGGGSVTGPLVFNGDVSLGDYTSVLGYVTSGGAVYVGTGTTITGPVHENVTPPPFTSVEMPSIEFTAGEEDITTGDGESITLAPGAYGDVILGLSNTLNLRTGHYYFQTLTVGGDSIINLDAAVDGLGVHVVGRASLGDRTVIARAGGSAANLRWETMGSWDIGSGVEWLGTISATNVGGRIAASDDLRLTGALYADSIAIGSGFLCEGAYSGEPPPIAEPLTATGALLAISCLAGYTGRRRVPGAAGV